MILKFWQIYCAGILLFSANLHLSAAEEPVLAAPGIYYYHERIESIPWEIHIAAIDLRNPWVKIDNILAHGKIGGRERTSEMFRHAENDVQTPVAAINADFFDGNGHSINGQIKDGILIRKPYPRSAFTMDQDGHPSIDIYRYYGFLTVHNDTFQISGINENRATDEMILYNRFNGELTHTNRWGSEVICRHLTLPEGVNAPYFVQVIGTVLIDSLNSGNTPIPENGFILSGHGTANEFILKKINIGDTLGIHLHLTPAEKVLRSMVGGTPRIIRDGKISIENGVESISETFSTTRHPRTAIGFNRDTTMLYLFTVDGRQPGFSLGMSLQELASYMLSWGVSEAINLDGGGSSTFILNGSVMNSPSDPDGERPVANALVVYNIAPKDTISRLVIDPNPIYTVPNSPFSFNIHAYDQYLHKYDPDQKKLQYRYDSTKVLKTDDNTWQIIEPVSPQQIIISHGTIHETLSVHLETIKYLDFSPKNIELAKDSTIQFYVKARNAHSDEIIVTPELFQWMYNHNDLNITPSGLITGLRVCQDTITLKGPDAYYLIPYTIGTLATDSLDYFNTSQGFTVSVNRGEAEADSLTKNELIIHYLFTGDARNDLSLRKDLIFNKDMREIQLDILGDGSRNWLRMELADSQNNLFLMNITPSESGINWTDSWKTIHLTRDNMIPHWNNPGAQPLYPLSIRQIYLIDLNGKTRKNGTLGLRNLQIKHFSKPQNIFKTSYLPKITIRQNPDAPEMELLFPNNHDSYYMRIIGVDGSSTDVSGLAHGTYIYDLTPFKPGIYFIVLNFGGSVTRLKIAHF